VRDGRLQRIEAVIQRQQRIAPESDDDGLLLDREDGRTRLPRAGRQIGHRGPLLPLRHGLLVDPVALRQSPQASVVAACNARSFRRECGSDRVRSSVRPVYTAFSEAAGRYGDLRIKSKTLFRALALKA